MRKSKFFFVLYKIKRILIIKSILRVPWLLHFLKPTPSRVHYYLTAQCNSRCIMCDVWKNQPKTETEISLHTALHLIHELPKLGIKELSITGGEPLTQKTKLMTLLKKANSHNIYTHFATNGFLLDKEFLDEYEQCGGGHIHVSLDGINEVHDKMRGVTGAYQKTLHALQQYTSGNYKKVRLKVGIIFSPYNLSSVLDVVKKMISFNIPITIQPLNQLLEHTTNKNDASNWYFSSEQKEQVEQTIQNLIFLKKNHAGLIINDIQHLQLILTFSLRNIGSTYTTISATAIKTPMATKTKNTRRSRCLVGFDTVRISAQGGVFTCHKQKPIGNIAKKSFTRILKGKEWHEHLFRILNCTDNCSTATCVYNKPLRDLFWNSLQYIKFFF